jgi:DNA repair exonuclease SbcCD ATPase subunit
MTLRALLLVTTAVSASGCAAIASMRGAPSPQAQLEAGAEAVQEQEYARARGLLEPLVYDRAHERVGQQALLLMLAAELDNRNPQRRLWAAADMAGRLLATDGVESWMVPVAESYYLLAMELGAAEERIAEAESARQQMARRLPTTTQVTVPERINRLTAERDQARRQAEQLQQQLATRDRELRETRAELERIRRTIRPPGLN